MTIIDKVGIIACLLTSSEAIPQILKMHLTGSSKDLSWISLWITFTCMAVWVFYGILDHDNWVTITCSICVFEYIWLMSWKAYYDSRQKRGDICQQSK